MCTFFLLLPFIYFKDMLIYLKEKVAGGGVRAGREWTTDGKRDLPSIGRWAGPGQSQEFLSLSHGVRGPST